MRSALTDVKVKQSKAEAKARKISDGGGLLPALFWLP